MDRASRGSVLRLILVVYLFLSTIDRAVLLAWSPSVEGGRPWDLPFVLSVGLAFDLIAISWLLMPASLYAFLAPKRLLRSRGQARVTRLLFIAILALLLFNLMAGWVFWDEFQARYNFIAVDYLVYTTEVVKNIQESYPMGWILAGLAVATGGVYFLLRGQLNARLAATTGEGRLAPLPMILIPIAAFSCVDNSLTRLTDNRYRNEIAKDNIYSFFAAFRDNTLDYEANFKTLPEERALELMRADLGRDGLEFVSQEPSDLRRHRAAQGDEQHLNVMMVVVESLSASYMTMFKDDGKDLTPRLDELVDRSLVFTQLYATGTRTVRGLEALTLSIPPTPGRAIIKRSGNEAMDNIGWQFRDRGYDTRFLYGGHGYFDNMNYFFSSNGFEIIDRENLEDTEVRFENAWGVCDQDIFARALREADESVSAGRPFFSLIMTTSNHRPFTYPDVVSIPPGTSRKGAVLYTDFAIGEFLDMAQSRKWFGDTLFVIVADHCAKSAGKTDVTISKHRIPMIFYAPGRIEAGRCERLASQIDFAPTLLAMLDFDYTSSMLGHDIFGPGLERAFVGNYQTLGLVRDGELCLLRTKRGVECLSVEDSRLLPEGVRSEALVEETIAWYQSSSAAWLRRAFHTDRKVKATRW